jgi:hypothetical protein
MGFDGHPELVFTAEMVINQTLIHFCFCSDRTDGGACETFIDQTPACGIDDGSAGGVGGGACAIYGCITMLSVFVVSFVGSIVSTNSLILAMIFLGLSLLSLLMVMLQSPWRQLLISREGS